jgi:hypothetical protein
MSSEVFADRGFYEAHPDEPSVYESEAWLTWVIGELSARNQEFAKRVAENPTGVRKEAEEGVLNPLKEHLENEPRRKVGDPGVNAAGMPPALVTPCKHISMAWIIHFRGTQRTDLNYEQITQAGRDLYKELQGE